VVVGERGDLLNALAAAERRLASATEPQHHRPVVLEPVLLLEDAIAVWSCAELASTLESPAGREFARSGTEIARMFSPAPQAQDTPDYGQRPPGGTRSG
jgi:hypothetical protein